MSKALSKAKGQVEWRQWLGLCELTSTLPIVYKKTLVIFKRNLPILARTPPVVFKLLFS